MFYYKTKIYKYTNDILAVASTDRLLMVKDSILVNQLIEHLDIIVSGFSLFDPGSSDLYQYSGFGPCLN